MLFLKYKYRYLCGHGILGLIFLSTLSLDAIYDKFSAYLSRRKQTVVYPQVLVVLFLIFFFIFSPSVQFKDKNFKFAPINSTYTNFMPDYDKMERGNEVSIYFSKFWEEIVGIVKAHSSKDDIIFCNMPYAGGLISVFADRATSTAMLQEIKPFRRVNPFTPAKLIIWIKNPEGTFDEGLSVAIDKYKLKKLTETEIAYIYENPNPTGKKRLVEPVVPSWIVYSLLVILIGLIILDNKKGLIKWTTK